MHETGNGHEVGQAIDDQTSSERPTPDNGDFVLALDNSGTLSTNTAVGTALVSDIEWASSVPNAPVERGRLALISVDHDSLSCLRVDRPLGEVLAEHDVSLYLALSNCDATLDEARDVVLAEETSARKLWMQTKRAAEQLSENDQEQVPGAQIVVDISAGRALRFIGYVATPKPDARDIVKWARDRGYQPHIVSGDTATILQQVADSVGVDGANIHPYQSPEQKARTIRQLRDHLGVPVVMVGDYVNDRFAFKAADVAVFIDDEEDEMVREVLAPRADYQIPDLKALPSVLSRVIDSIS